MNLRKKTINFNPTQIASSCPITGFIYYKDSFGEAYETQISKFNLAEAVTTTPLVPKTDRNYIWYIIIVVAAVVAVILVIFKVPKVRNFLSQKFHKPVDKEIEEENEEKNK